MLYCYIPISYLFYNLKFVLVLSCPCPATRLHKVRRAQPAADPPRCPASREARKARTELSTSQWQGSRRTSTGERRCAPLQWDPCPPSAYPSTSAPQPAPRWRRRRTGAPRPPRPASNKPKRQPR